MSTPSPLPSFKEGYRALVFGASGGIGSAFVQALAGDDRCASVHATSRQSLPETEKTIPLLCDITEEASIQAAVEQARTQSPPDLVIVATGMLHGATQNPEKTFRTLDPITLAKAYAINAIGPALIAKHVLPHLPRDRKTVFAALSARVSSLSDNHTGGWHAYRASKAALNMLVRNCAIELAMRNKLSVCVTLHPGTVDTALSKPFQSGLPAKQLFTPAQSASHLLTVIDQLTPNDTGQLFAWDGKSIPF
jgi:NAD(P)-dependent dehydrogenase (short-subunit alcohol dehydrogenase family)